jgi:hypothetical protein
MSDSEDPKLVAGYGTNTLNDAETARLWHAAAEDQSVFDAIMQEQDMRDLLDDYVCRKRVLDSLRRDRAGWLARFTFVRPSAWAFAGAMAATVLIVATLRYGKVERPEEYTVALSAGPSISMRDLGIQRRSTADNAADPVLALPPQHAIDVDFGINKGGARPVYRPGEPMRMGFKVKTGANVVVVETRADGSEVQLFPNFYISSPRVPANQQVLIPPAGQGDMQVEGTAGPRRVRVLVTPPDVDPLKLDRSGMSALAGRVTVMEREYLVQPEK